VFIFFILVYYCFSDVIEVTVNPGDDAILPCQAAGSSIKAVAWTRPDLEPDIVLYCSDGHLDTTNQHPSFKDRVELVDRDLKDGDVSLILKNVRSIDNGTYKCGVAPDSSRRTKRSNINSEPIRTVRLKVTDPLTEVTMRPGDDVILPCQAATFNISVVKRRDQDNLLMMKHQLISSSTSPRALNT
uniref:Ig-like domain-containing protein n=1 Tax=Sander lucioperca TaxID=283035 RepID=A0A8D0AIL2_SANLU